MTTEPESLRASLPKSDGAIEWQFRQVGLNSDEQPFQWKWCSERDFHEYAAMAEYETRALYTSSPDSRSVIPLQRESNTDLRLEEGNIYFCRNGERVRMLDEFEEDFVLSALKNSPPPPPGWVSVEKELPTYEQDALLSGWVHNTPNGTRWYVVGYLSEQDACFYKTDDGPQLHTPTHWMPLPIPPKA